MQAVGADLEKRVGDKGRYEEVRRELSEGVGSLGRSWGDQTEQALKEIEYMFKVRSE